MKELLWGAAVALTLCATVVLSAIAIFTQRLGT